MKRWFLLILPQRRGMSIGEARLILDLAWGLHYQIRRTLGPGPERDFHLAQMDKLDGLKQTLAGLRGEIAVPRWAKDALKAQRPVNDALQGMLRARYEAQDAANGSADYVALRSR